uniref:Putative 52 kDa repressor of the inhibitor of the protein kin n=1 Tax=Ixodes ricinus TaxID=34613 RepID=V5HUL5_IXORI
MTGCSVTKCTNRADSGKSLYRIPTARHDVRRRLVWLLRMGRRSPTPKNARICEDHFESKEFETCQVNGRRKLKPSAVPSLFLNLDCHPATEEQSANIASQVDVRSAILSKSVKLEPAADIASQVDAQSAILLESVKHEHDIRLSWSGKKLFSTSLKFLMTATKFKQTKRNNR